MMMLRVLGRCGCVLLVLAGAARLNAQTAAAQQPVVNVPAAMSGDCAVVVTVRDLAVAATIEVQLDKNRIAIATVQPPGGTITTLLRGPLEDGDDIRVLVNGASPKVFTVQPLDKNVAPKCRPPRQSFDDRTNFEVTGYLGAAFDNFAPNEVGNYRNPENSTNIKARFIAGTDAQFRFWPRDVDKRNSSDVQVWLGAETLHGVRTADVNCKASPDVPVCKNNPNPDPTKFLWILEHASSLEVFISPRVELFTIQRDGDTPIKLYVGGRFGFLTAEGGASLYRNDHVGGGILAPIGPFAGSYVEIGWGRSAMFHEASGDPAGWDRMKIDATLMFDFAPGWKDRINPFKRMASATRGFVELYIDQSPGSRNPQSVQSFAGMQFDFRDAFGK